MGLGAGAKPIAAGADNAAGALAGGSDNAANALAGGSDNLANSAKNVANAADNTSSSWGTIGKRFAIGGGIGAAGLGAIWLIPQMLADSVDKAGKQLGLPEGVTGPASCAVCLSMCCSFCFFMMFMLMQAMQ